MSCELSQIQLQAYFDGELDATSAAAFESHLKSCRECQSALVSEEALRSSIAQANLYEHAPAELRCAITAQLLAAPSVPARAAATYSAWRWLALAASVLFLATLGWQLFQRYQGGTMQPAIVAAALDAHLRSLQQGHLADVESSDQHTVKPWFDGKLDFAPPVRDFAVDGFPLMGGRLDVLQGRTVAALVYGRRKHIINVFVSPESQSLPGPASGSLRGYNWTIWQNGGFSFYVVSDVNTADLEQLRQLFLHP